MYSCPACGELQDDCSCHMMDDNEHEDLYDVDSYLDDDLEDAA